MPQHKVILNPRPTLALLALLSSATLCADKNKKYVPPPLPDPDPYVQPLATPTPLSRTPLYSLQTAPTRTGSRHFAGKIKGIDVSRYQGSINWRNVAFDNHASYAYVKCTESASLVDPRYYENIREARRAKVPVGSYHFYSPSVSPTTQLLNFTNTMRDIKSQDLIPLVDVEVRGKCNYKEFIENLRQFLRGIENRYGVKPMIYTGQNFYNKYLCGRFDEYMYMIARYGDELPSLNGNPKLVIWQYSESGRVAGIRGNVDLSTFVDDYTLRDIMIKK